MSSWRRISLVSLLLIESGAPLAAPANPWQEVAQRFHRDRGFSGVVLVVKGGRTVYSGAFGSAAPKVPNTVNTRFRVASVCKLLLAVTTLRLQEEGKLRLDDPLSQYLKIGSAAGRVTIRQLLSHTSGLPNPEEVETPPIQAYRTPLSLDAYVAKYLGAPTFAPGSRFSYNNFDFIVLSKVIERAVGEAWSAAIKRRVLDPSGMTSSGLFTDERVPVHLALGQYRDASRAWQPDPPFLISRYFGAGALYATAPDLAKFDAALRANKLISAASQAELFAAKPSFGYVALGNWVYPQPFSGRTVRVSERYGNVWGSFAILARGLDEANTVIVLSNRHDSRGNVENDLKAELLRWSYR